MGMTGFFCYAESLVYNSSKWWIVPLACCLHSISKGLINQRFKTAIPNNSAFLSNALLPECDRTLDIPLSSIFFIAPILQESSILLLKDGHICSEPSSPFWRLV